MALIHGEGSASSGIMLVGEGPGWQEERAGRVFAGKSGDELDRFCDGRALPTRAKMWVTNIYREFKGQDYDWTADDLALAEPFLQKELARIKPRIIVPLGRPATRYFLGDVDMGSTHAIPWVHPDDITHTKRGKKTIRTFTKDARIIFPIYHPAAGLRNPEISPLVVHGFQELSRFWAGKLAPRMLYHDDYPDPVYEEVTDVERLKDILRANTIGAEINIAIDTEGFPGRPWSLQFSFHPGTGYLIRATAAPVLRCFADYVRSVRPRLTFHSALHDLSVGRELGVFDSRSELRFDDTMVMAWLLQIEEQGLKPLCVRHHGMRMQSFDEVMGDAQQRLMEDYLTWIWDAEEFDYEERQQAKFAEINSTPLCDTQGRPKFTKDGRARYRKTTVLPTVPKTPLHKAVVRALQSKNATKLWGDQVEDIQVAGYHRMGEPPQATLDYVPRDVAVRYGCRDSDGTTRVRTTLRPRIHDMGLDEVYALELSTIPLIDRMSQVGILPDLDHFAYVSEGLGYEIESLKFELEQETGIAGFNANRGDQVEAFLAPLGIMEGMKRTSTGRFSTNDKILEALEHEHPEYPVLSKIREYRETYKLKNTFVDRLPDFVHRWPHDGRVHATFRTTRVVTGRLAASEPNILAQPEHGKFAADFKRGWVAGDGHVLAAWDESQIELRGLAHLSQDPVMLAVFRGEKRNKDGSLVDLHAALAERIFGVPPHKQDKHKHRFPAKAVNFGIPMGMTNKGLAVELRKNGVYVTEDDAQRWLDETLGLYKGVKRYMEQRIKEAQVHGFVRCLSGRIRYIGGIRSSDERTRAEAERFAFSTPIQESAQFIMKQAEAQVWDMLKQWWREGLYVEPLYQQHDALKFEVAEGLQPRLHKEVSLAMTRVPKAFTVPLEVEGEWGYNMADMKRFS